VLTESLLLATLGGTLGAVVGWQALHAIVALRPGALVGLANVRFGGTALGCTAAVSLVTGLVFGVAPALVSGSGRTRDALRTGTLASGHRVTNRVRGGMVVVEVALSFVFVVTAGLLLQSFVALVRTPLGYDPRDLVAAEVKFAAPPPRSDRDAVARTLITTTASLLGTNDVAIGRLPQTNIEPGPLVVGGPDGAQTTDVQLLAVVYVNPDYFRVTRLDLARGRTFDTQSGIAASDEVVVNEALARRLWPNGNAIGAKLRLSEAPGRPWLTVVGIARDVHIPGALPAFFDLQMYRPTSAASGVVSTLVFRTRGGIPAARPVLRQAIDASGRRAEIGEITSAETMVNNLAYARPRFALAVFGLFAVVALALAAVGLFGVIAYMVANRTREIGIRMALGATSASVRHLVLGGSTRLALLGCAVGVVGAFTATRSLAGFLEGVSLRNPVAFGGAAVVLTLVALAAAFVPMRRALRLNPADALRAD